MVYEKGRTSRMEESWGLSASLALSWLEREPSPAKTTISGQQTSQFAYVSIKLSLQVVAGMQLQRRDSTLCCDANSRLTWHHDDSIEFIMAWSTWWPICCDDEYLTGNSFFLSPMFAVHSWFFISLCSLSVFPIIPPVPCMSNFTAPSGTVLSPDYPEGYGNNMNCVWLIQSDPGSRIHLAFNDFDLEAPYDSLTVKDGETNDAPVIGRFTGAESPSHLTSNTYTLRLEFQADHSMSGRGFNITYSCRSFFSVYSSFLFMEMTNVVSRVRQ